VEAVVTITEPPDTGNLGTSTCRTTQEETDFPEAQVTVYLTSDDAAAAAASSSAYSALAALPDLSDLLQGNNLADCTPVTTYRGPTEPFETEVPEIHTSVDVLTSVAPPIVVQGVNPPPVTVADTLATANAAVPVNGDGSGNTVAPDSGTPTTDGGNGFVAGVLAGLGLPTDVPQTPAGNTGDGTSPQGVSPQPPIVVGGQTVVPAGSGGGVIIGGQTIAPGAAATLGNGIPVSVAPGGGVVVVAGQSAAIPAANPGITGGPGVPPVPVVVGGQTLTPAPGGGVIIGGQTVAPGAVITLADGTPVSVAQGGSVVVVAGQTAAIPGPGTGNSNQGTPITVNGATITPIAGGAVVVNGQTVLPGSVVTLADGKPLSVAPGGTAVVVGGQSVTIPSIPAQTGVPSPVIINGETITPAPSGGAVIVGGQTVSPGSAITLSDGNVISVGTSGTIVVDGTTTTLAAASLGMTSTGSSNQTSSTRSSSSHSVGAAIASGIGGTKKGAASNLLAGNDAAWFTCIISFFGFIGMVGIL
jgi:hypothetical protein